MWHPVRILRRGLERARPILSALLAIPAAVSRWLGRHLGRPLRRGFEKALTIVAPVSNLAAGIRYRLGRRLARLLRRSLEAITALTSPVSRAATGLGRRLTRPLDRALSWVSRKVANFASPGLALMARFGHILGKWFRRTWRGFSQKLEPVFRPVAVLWGVAGHWLDRHFGRFFRRCAQLLRPLVVPFQAFYQIVARWAGRRFARLLRINRKKALLVTSAVLVILFIGGFWQGRPLYHKFKERRFLGLAHLFLQRGEDLKAMICARNVLAYNPKSVAASEILADLADRSKSPQAMIWRRRVVELDPTPDNRIKLVDCALRYEPAPFPLAAKTLAELTDQETIPFHLVSARFAIQLNQLPQAEAHFEAAIRLDPTNELHRLNLAVLRHQSTNSARASSARATLENLRTHAGVGLEALRWLTHDSLNRKDLVSARQLADQLQSNPHSVFSDRLLYLSILHQMKSADLASALQAVQTHWATNAPQAAEIGNWMIARGQAQAALRWLQQLEESLRSQQPIPLTTASCFQANEDWRGLEGFLQALDWGKQEFIRQALMARALRKLGETATADAYWQQALRTASERPEFTAILAQTTRSWGWNREAEQLLSILSTRFAAQPWALPYVFQQYHAMGNTQGLFQVFSTALDPRSTNTAAQDAESLLAAMNTRAGTEPWALWVMRHLFDYYVSTGNTRGIYQILSTVLDRGSDDIAIKNNLAAVAMLLQTNLPMAHTLARQVYEREPGNASVVSTYAYSLHLQGRTAEALKLLQGLSPRDLKQPSVAVYYGFLLVAGSEALKANDYLTAAEGGTLLPEEKELIAQARRKLPPGKP
jgi:tetratricopeptide (TPR) repeat protein